MAAFMFAILWGCGVIATPHDSVIVFAFAACDCVWAFIFLGRD